MVLPGSYHHISRRCTERKFLLVPDKEVRELVVYCFAVGARRFGIEVLRLMVMSNHYHATVFDREGRLPEFLTWVHRAIARGLNRRWHTVGNVFESNKATSDVLIVSEEAFWKTMDYVHTNPVSAQLCKRPEDWSGTLTPAGVTSLEARRPEWMTDTSGPKTLTLRIHMPEHFVSAGCTEAQYHAQLKERDAEAVATLRKQMRAEGKHRFLGKDKAMRVSPTSKPRTREQSARRGVSPRFAAVTAIAMRAAQQMLRDFHEAYQEALARFRAGARDTVFPKGTWKMTRLLQCCGAD